MLSFTVGRCQIVLHFSFFAGVAGAMVFAGAFGSFDLLTAVFLHEGAHIAIMYLFSAPPKKITVSLLGCRMLLSTEKRLTYFQSMVVFLAGPLSHWLFCACSLLFSLPPSMLSVHLAMGMLHSLPIEPLDGGLALRSLLSCFMETDRARKWMLWISLFFLFPLAVLGFGVLLYTKNNFSLLALSVYLMLYLVLKRDFLH